MNAYGQKLHKKILDQCEGKSITVKSSWYNSFFTVKNGRVTAELSDFDGRPIIPEPTGLPVGLDLVVCASILHSEGNVNIAPQEAAIRCWMDSLLDDIWRPTIERFYFGQREDVA